MKANAVVVRHVAFEDLGTLSTALHERGISVSFVEAGMDDLSAIDPLAPDLLVVLGGPIGAYDDAIHPFLKDELKLLQQRLAAGKPTLGICLGAQLMACALGARVYPGRDKEIGWSPLIPKDIQRHPYFAHLSNDRTQVLHWHGDTFDLPDGAIHLAATPLYENQAFAWGESCLALQFHPEVTAGGLERWFIGHACEINATPGISVPQLRADTYSHASSLQKQAALFWRAWLDHVLGPQSVAELESEEGGDN